MKKFILIYFIIIISLNSYSQLVNIEKERKKHREGFQGFTTCKLSITKNTNKIIQASNTTNLQYINKKHTILLLNDYSVMKVTKNKNNIDLKNSNFQHIRYNYSIIDTNKICLETFIQHQQNKLKYLKNRWLAGTGMRFQIIKTKTINIYTANLLMYENETLTDSLKTKNQTIKDDIYASINITINQQLTISNITYYQPTILNIDKNIRFGKFNDFRILSDFIIAIEILKNLEFSVGFNLAYDSKPPTELKDNKLFYDVSNKLTYKF